MRRRKKVLALVLAMAMSLSLAVTAGAAFNDQDKIVNEEAVDMCVALNIINGRTDGSFDPAGNVTRAEAAKMITIALNGGKEPTLSASATPTYTDIAGHWAAKYIEYCTSLGIVAGDGAGKFNPNGNVKAVELAKMLLIALGYNAQHEKFVGANWDTNVNVIASQKDLYEDLETIDPAVAATRDTAAQMVWNALQALTVKYDYTLVGSNGNLNSQITVEDTDKTLLETKYGTSEFEGRLVDWTYNTDKAEWTYELAYSTVVTEDGQSSVVIAPKFFTTDADYTDLFMQDVKVIYKDKDVYGIFANDSVVIVEDIIGNIDDLSALGTTTDEVTVGDVDYKVDTNVDGTNVIDGAYAFGVNICNSFSTIAALDGYQAFSFKAIDNDDNGKIDTLVYFPFTVEKVTYVGSETFSTNKTLKAVEFENVNYYEGIAVDDYVVVTAAANTADVAVAVEKVEAVSGEVTVINDGDYTIGGEVYTDLTGSKDLALGNEVEIVAVNGFIFYAEKVSGTIAMTDVVYIDAVEVKSSYGKDTLMAKAYFADGTSADIEIKSTNGAEVIKNDKLVSGADKWAVKYDLWAYELDGSKYELTSITSGTDKDFDYSTTVTAAGDDRIGDLRANDDAVIFVKDGDGDVSVVTGADVKAWSKGTAAAGTVYANETSGYNYVELAALTVTGDVPGASADDVYGYVIAKLGDTKEDNKTYTSYSVWTGAAEPVTVKVEAGKTDGAAKGDFIKVDEGEIDVLTGKAAVKAFDDQYITFYNVVDDKGVLVEFEITADTKVIYVNTKTVAGAEGGAIAEATDHNVDGTYEANVVYLEGDTAGELAVLFVDVNNELDGETAADYK